MLVGVVAHTDSAVGQVAEHAAAIFPGDGGVPAAAYGVALLRAVEGIGLGGLHRNLEVILLRVEASHNAVQFLAGVVLIPQVGDGGVPQLPLGQIDVMAVALHQTAPGPHRQHPALDLCPDPVQSIPVSKEIPLGSGGQAPGGHGHAVFPVHLDDDEVNGCPHHVLENEVGPGLFLLPHLGVGDDHPHPVGYDNGAVHGFPLHLPGLLVPNADVQGVHTDDGPGEGAAAPVGSIDGVPLLALLRCQAPIQGVEVQTVEALPVVFLGFRLRRRGRRGTRFHPEGLHGGGLLWG